MRFLPVCYCWHTTPYTPYFWPGPPGCRHDADRTAHRPGPGYAGYRVSGTRSFPAESAMHAVMPRPSFYHLGSRAVCWPWWQGRVLLDRADPECLHGAAGGSYSTIFIPFRVMKHVHTMSLEYIWSVHPALSDGAQHGQRPRRWSPLLPPHVVRQAFPSPWASPHAPALASPSPRGRGRRRHAGTRGLHQRLDNTKQRSTPQAIHRGAEDEAALPSRLAPAPSPSDGPPPMPARIRRT